jgi:hypothetical protein
VGERVIVTGQLTVMPGAKVRLTSEAAGQSAAAGAVASTGGSKS